MNFRRMSVFTFFMILMLARNLVGKFLLIKVKNASEIVVAPGRSKGIPLFRLYVIIISYKIH